MRFGSLYKVEELSKADESPDKMLQEQSIDQMDKELLNGAQSRANNFRLHLNDQEILQEQQRNRLLTSDSYQGPQTPNSQQNSHNPSGMKTANSYQMQICNTSPTPTGFGLGDVGQLHKSSIATLTAGRLDLNNASNNFYNMKSTNSQTPQTIMMRHKDSNNYYQSSKPEEENLKSHNQTFIQEQDSDGRRPNLQINNIRKNSSFSLSNNNFLNNPSLSQINNNATNIQNKYTIANHINCLMSQHNSSVKDQLSPINFVPLPNLKNVISNNEGTEETDSQQQKAGEQLDTAKNRGMSKASSNQQRKSRFSGVLGSPSMKGLGFKVNSSDILKNLNIMKHARQFMQKLLNFTLQSNFKYLRQKHYDLIGDSSSFYQQSDQYLEREEANPKEQSLLRKSFKSVTSMFAHKSTLTQKSLFHSKVNRLHNVFGMFSSIVRKIPVFDPDSFFFIIWDMIMLAIQVIIFLIVPLTVSFELNLHIPGIETTGISAIAGGFFFLDAIITLNRGVYVSGVAVLDRHEIVRNYLKNILFTDFVTLIALSNFSGYVSLLILIRISYIRVLINRLDDHFSIRMRYPDVMQLASMISSTVMIAHLCACGFHLVSRLSYEVAGCETSMIRSKENLNYTWIDMYIASLYFAFITMSTVGYGDVIPKNNYERVYVMIMTMLSSALFGYVINTIGSIYTSMAQKRAIFEQKKFDIITYMGNRNLPKHMQMKAIKYLEYTQFRKNETHIKGEAIINQLPSQLSNEIKQEFFGKILHQNKLFNSHFSSPVISQLALKMKELSLAPGEFLIQAGQKDNRIYFLLEGSLSIYIQCQSGVQKKIATIDEKHFMIGQRSFFCEYSKTKWVKCDTSSNFAYCDLKDFKDILLNHQLEYEVFCEIRDQIMFEEKTADTQCASCDKFSHSFSNCPLIHLKLNKSKIIYSNYYSEPQTRQKTDSMNRSYKKRTYHAFKDRQLLRQQLKKLRIEQVKQQIQNEQNDVQSLMNASSMTRFLEQDDIQSYENYNFTICEDKDFFLSVPEISPLCALNCSEEQFLQNQQYRQMLTTENDDDEDDDEDNEDDINSCNNQDKDFSKHQNENTGDNIDFNDKLNFDQEKLPQIPSYSVISERPQYSQNNTSSSQSKIEIINNQQGALKQNFFSKALAAFDESTVELRKNMNSVSISKNQEETLSFQLPRNNSETSIHMNSKQDGGQNFQYMKQLSSQSVKFSQNQTMNNCQQQKENSQSQSQSQQLQPLLAQNLNEQLIKLITQAIANQNMSINNNNSNPNTLSLNNSLAVLQPINNGVRRPSFQRIKSRKGTHKKSVTIMKQKTMKASSQTAHLQNITSIGDQIVDTHIKSKSQQLYFYDFEMVKNMTKYFPKYNIQNVVQVQNKYYKLRMNSIRKSIRKDNINNINGNENRSTTMIGRNSILCHSPIRKRKEQTVSLPQPFSLRCKKIKQTIIIEN